MDNYIRKLHVKSLFEEKTDLKIEFDEKINCLFGVNGSGKTTIINILVASMFCDISKLSSLSFSKVSIYISPANKRRAKLFFEVAKTEGKIEYKFSEEYYFPEFESNEQFIFEFSRNSKRDPDRVDEKKKSAITELINANVSTTYVPLSRMHESDIYETNGRPEEFYFNQAMRSRHMSQEEYEDIFDPSRRMLLKLEATFKQKYSETQKEINKDLDSLKDTILEKLLLSRAFSNKYARQNVGFNTRFSKPNYEDYSKKLRSANLRISDESLKEHFDVMEENITSLNRLRDEYKSLAIVEGEVDSESVEAKKKKIEQEYGVEASKYRALNPFYERFFDVLEDVEDIQLKKDEALKPFTNTERLINDFLINKSFSFTSIGGFEIKCGTRIIKLADLSSGEKHMIALLGRVALSPEQGAVFVADEPELSLHLEWQRKILPAIQLLSPNIQIIVATHSPAIIPSGAKLIDLAECVK